MKKQKLCLCVGLSLAMSLSALESVHYDFASAPPAPNFKTTGGAKGAVFEDGMLKVRGGGVSFDLPADQPCRLSFQYRTPGYSVDPKTGVEHTSGWWGVNVLGDEGRDAHLYAFDNSRFVFSYTQNKAPIFTTGGKIPRPTVGREAQWHTFVLVCDGDATSVSVDGATIAQYSGTLLPLARFSVWPWRMFLDMKDFELTPYTRVVPKVTEKPVFSLDCEHGFDAVDAAGAKVAPVINKGFKRIDGVQGKALSGEDEGQLVYPAEGLFKNHSGTIVFWGMRNPGPVRKAKEDKEYARGRSDGVFNAADGKTNKITAGMNPVFPSFNFAVQGTTRMTSFTRNNQQRDGEWYHYAITWQSGREVRYFANGMPYVSGFMPANRGGLLTDPDLETVKELVFPRKCNLVIDNFKVYDRALSNAEVLKEYRAAMPIDLVMEDAVLPAGTPASITLQAAPGGFFQRPHPAPDVPLVNAAGVTLDCVLLDDAGQTVFSETQTLDVNTKTNVVLQPRALPVGLYELACTVNWQDAAYRRFFSVYCEASLPRHAAANDRGWTVGRKILGIDFTRSQTFAASTGNPQIRRTAIGDYLEMGPEKHDSVFLELAFPERMLHKPCLLEFTWPDDKPRMSGFFMYRKAQGTHRDRLGAYIQSGAEYPETGTMRTSRYTFMPGTDEYLFEIRTGGTHHPAALAKLAVYEMDPEFPVLAIRTPEGLPGRTFGHVDEDQTFDQNLCYDSWDAERLKGVFAGRTAYVNSVLFNYLNYIGMNAFTYPIFRYQYGYDSVEGSGSSGMYPYGAGQLRSLLDTFAAHGKKFYGVFNPLGVPQIKLANLTDNDYVKQGMVLRDRYGNVVWSGRNMAANPCHPGVQKMLFDNYRNLLANYANHPGLGGLCVTDGTLAWISLDYGYGDFTVGKFSRDTGIAVPPDTAERYAFLTGAKRKEWLEWRARQITQNVANYRKLVDEYNPGLKLHMMISLSPDNYEKRGIDFPAIRALPGIETGFMRHLNGYRWNIHFGRPESSADFINYDFDNEEVKLLRETGGLEFLIDFEVYFETFFNAPLKKYSCYFQSANGKPIGRHYLKELAFDVGALDARNIMIGAQPLSAHGVEDESREFARAFCALPALPFQKVPGDTDPVVVRSLSTQNGTYFYAVNMSYFPVGVKLDFGKRKTLGLFGGERYTDLSTGTDHSSDTIGLLPFQLRSFLSANQGLRIASAVVAGRSREADEYFAGRLALLETAASTLEEHNVSCQEQRLAIARIRDEVACGHWAEAHRRAFDPLLNKMLRDCDDIANIAERQRLIDQGTYRVNFGCFTFNRFNDLLFFSDQMYTGKNLYGCVANAFKSCTRDITGIQGAAIPDLFQTEAYDVDGCRFKLPDGQYTVTLFLKCGFRPGFKPGKFVFNMAINGAPPETLDLYELAKGDFNQALELVRETTVANGMLALDFTVPAAAAGQPPTDSTARTLNAIVITRK